MPFDLNAYLLNPENLHDEFKQDKYCLDGYRQVRIITCADGLSFSAQASKFHYCTPRNSIGPWTAVEIGFPSQRVGEFMEYADDPDDATGTVYGYVPVEAVEAVIDRHGGIVEPCLSDSEPPP